MDYEVILSNFVLLCNMKCQEKPVQILLCPLFSLHEIYIYIENISFSE